mgnify:CR=1 FL=1
MQMIYLEEKNEVPKEYAGMKVESKGFYEPVVGKWKGGYKVWLII